MGKLGWHKPQHPHHVNVSSRGHSKDKSKWNTVDYLVSRYLEPSQPQRIIINIMAKLKLQSVSCVFCTQVIKTLFFSPKSTKSVLAQIYVAQNVHVYTIIEGKNFQEWVLSVLLLLKKKKAHKARAHWYCEPFSTLIRGKGVQNGGVGWK